MRFPSLAGFRDFTPVLFGIFLYFCYLIVADL